MKKRRTTLIAAAAVLAVLVILLFAVKKKTADYEAESSKKEMLLDLTADGITGIRYQAGDAEEVGFVREDGTWTYEKDPGLALNQTAVGMLASSLTGVGVTQKMENAGDLSRYGLSEPSYRLRIRDKDGKEYVLSIGNVNDITGDVYVETDREEGCVYAVSPGLITHLDKSIADYLPEESESESEAEAAFSVESVPEP